MNQRHLRRPAANVQGYAEVPAHRVLAAALATNADDSGVVMVFLAAFAPALQRGPVHGCKPQAVVSGPPLFAKRGDHCAVVLDEQNTWWMVTWEAS